MVSINVDKSHAQTNTQKKIGTAKRRGENVSMQPAKLYLSVRVKERSIYHDPRRTTANPLGVAESH